MATDKRGLKQKKFLTPQRLIQLISLIGFVPVAMAYGGSSFNNIRETIFAEPYDELPYYKVSKKRFGPSGDTLENHLLAASRRTLTSDADLIDFPQGHKLLNANGICFSGEWRINKGNPYTGQFKSGTSMPVIARASVALSGTERKHKRAFAVALKLFPSSDKNQPVKTLNTFLMHSLGGVRTQHVLDLTLDNEPSLGSLPPLNQLSTALRMRTDFNRANEEHGAKPARVFFQPISHLAQLDTSGPSHSPRWLRLKAKEQTPRINESDFRKELDLTRYPKNQLIWDIEVAEGDPSMSKKKARWLRIGELVLNDSVVSASCDKRLHFPHTGSDDQ